MSEELSAPTVLAALVAEAQAAGVSDIHLHRHGTTATVAFRLDGVLAPVREWPNNLAERVFGRVKFLARLKTYQESLPQDGRIPGAELGTRHDVRVATYPTVTGEKIVLRLFNETAARSLSDLGLAVPLVAELKRFLGRTSGLLLLTGPAGSGKTTTIYACLRHLAQAGGRHVITVEDPVEQVVPGVMQTEVNEARGLTFAKAARHLVRQDPQVLVLGEIRDDETADVAVRAALTGHMVIATLHAGSCQGVVDRLLAMCPDRYAVVSQVELVVNQRLLRRVCAGCAGAGCAVCAGTGYKGCVPVAEWARLDDAVRARMATAGTAAVAPALPLADAARELVAHGVTTAAETRRVLGA